MNGYLGIFQDYIPMGEICLRPASGEDAATRRGARRDTGRPRGVFLGIGKGKGKGSHESERFFVENRGTKKC